MMWSKLRRYRKLGCISAGILLLLVLLSFGLMILDIRNNPAEYLRWGVSDGIKGHPEHCEHFVSDARGIRLTYTPYSIPRRAHGSHIDPNHWENLPLATEFMRYGIIVIPAFDYSVTRDGGASWEAFGHVENYANYFPNCDDFGSLDAENFWVWAGTLLAITHDGGGTWFTPNMDVKQWNPYGYLRIRDVTFDGRRRGWGRMTFRNPTGAEPVLISEDNGSTWQLDPVWNATDDHS